MQIGILIPKRPQFGNEYWCMQRKFASGFHVVEVDEKQLAELKSDPVAQVLEGKALEAHMPAAPAAPSAPAKQEEPAAEVEKPGKPMKRG